MKTAKVVEITKVNEWKWPNGTVFYINMKLDNDDTISLGKKKADAFKVGDTVNYEVVEEGKKWKEVKENPFRPRANYDSNNKWAMVGMALKIAFECYYDKKADNFKDTIEFAKGIVDEAMGMLWEEEKPESNENLPF